jgi:hypothetical protein
VAYDYGAHRRVVCMDCMDQMDCLDVVLLSPDDAER